MGKEHNKEMTNQSVKAASAMSLRQFLKKFPDEKAATDYFLDIRYKGNLSCPHCGATVSIYRYRERPKFFQCPICNNIFSPFKDTIADITDGLILTDYAIFDGTGASGQNQQPRPEG